MEFAGACFAKFFKEGSESMHIYVGLYSQGLYENYVCFIEHKHTDLTEICAFIFTSSYAQGKINKLYLSRK